MFLLSASISEIDLGERKGVTNMTHPISHNHRKGGDESEVSDSKLNVNRRAVSSLLGTAFGSMTPRANEPMTEGLKAGLLRGKTSHKKSSEAGTER
jgi:hypothetical protein